MRDGRGGDALLTLQLSPWVHAQASGPGPLRLCPQEMVLDPFPPHLQSPPPDKAPPLLTHPEQMQRFQSLERPRVAWAVPHSPEQQLAS